MPKVTLRYIPLSNGKIGLYSDTYPTPAGLPRRKSLGIFISQKPQTPIDRKYNREQIEIAEAVCRRKANELSKPEIYSSAELGALKRQDKGNYSFFDFADRQVAKITGSGQRVYATAITYFRKFTRVDIKCPDITLLMVDEFKDYIPDAKKLRSDAIISHNSASTYFAAFCSILRDCYKGEYLQTDIGRMVDGIPPKQGDKEALTVQEIQALASTHCEAIGLKEMALFSCLTGLRFSDCSKLAWSEVKGNDSTGYRLEFDQQKTNGGMVHPISNEAYNLLGGGQGKNPFGNIDYHNMQRSFKRWVDAAGIDKHITFHTFRHSYACMLIENDVDVFTVSKMLGHKSVRSTHVYAKVADQKKVLAANAISLNL